MNNTQLYLSIGLPMLTIILTWLASRAEMNRQIDRIDRSIESLRVEMSALRADFNRDMVAFRKEIHEDLILLHERVVKVEARQIS